MTDLRLGDCLDLMREIPDKSIDLVLCDLPYGTTDCKWDVVIPLDSLWEQYRRIVKDRGAVVLFGQEPFSSIVRTSNLEMYRYDWIWKKRKPSNFQLMGFQCGRITENIMVFSKAKACYVKSGNTMKYNPQTSPRNKARTANAKIYGDVSGNMLHRYKTDDNFKTYDCRQPVNILDFPPVTKGKTHPAQKPVELLEYLIMTYTDKEGIVLDNCMGSGSTGVACVNIGRHFIGIEKEEAYFKTASDRINEQIHNSANRLF